MTKNPSVTPVAAATARLRAHSLTRERIDALSGDRRGRLGDALDRRPLVTAVLVLAGIFVVGTLVGTLVGTALGNAVLPEHDDVVTELTTDVLRSALVLALLTHLGWFSQVGFTGPRRWHSLHLLLPPLAVALLAAATSLGDADVSDAARTAVAAPQPLLTGFWEEGLTRGFLLLVLLAAAVRAGRGPMAAVIASSVTFGLMHIVNLVGGDPAAVGSQILVATMLGVCFAALLLRTNALWLLVVLHALFNLGTALSPEDAAEGFQVGTVVLTLPLALYGLFLLRRNKTAAFALEGEPSARTA